MKYDVFDQIDHTKLNHRFIESVKVVNPDEFLIVSSEFAKGDANNFPSLKYCYRIIWQKDKRWKITGRERVDPKSTHIQ